MSTGSKLRARSPENGATIAEVSRRAGVSIATVSRVFHNVPGQVSSQTRRRVQRAIRELDYRPNALARGLHQGRTHTLGLLVPDIANPYYAGLTAGIEAVARRSGYALFICNTERDPSAMAHYVQVCREHRADGVIVAGGATWGQRHLAGLAARGTPAVVIGRHGIEAPTVLVDNATGAYHAAEHLIAAGHRRIAVISGPPESTTVVDRLAGYRHALERHGIGLPARLLRPGDLRPASGRKAAEDLLRARPRPTAILAANDQMAIGAMAALHAAGVRVPQDVSVVGFDDIDLASYVTPSLSTMALPLTRMGEAAMELMLRRLGGDDSADQVWFVPELVVRASSGPGPEGVSA